MTQHVSDVMTSALVTVEPQVSVTAVARMMRDEDIGAVLVTDGEQSTRLAARAFAGKELACQRFDPLPLRNVTNDRQEAGGRAFCIHETAHRRLDMNGLTVALDLAILTPPVAIGAQGGSRFGLGFGGEPLILS
jgi:CBS domain-containing protein